MANSLLDASIIDQNNKTYPPDHERTTCRITAAKAASKVALPTVVGAHIGFVGIAAASSITSLAGATVSVSEFGAAVSSIASLAGATVNVSEFGAAIAGAFGVTGASTFGIGLVVGVPAFLGLIIGIIWACRGTQDLYANDFQSYSQILCMLKVG